MSEMGASAGTTAAHSALAPDAGQASQTQAGGKAEALKAIAGLLAVVVGLAALTAIALVAIGVVSSDSSSVVSIASASFGVIGTIVGAYFGAKIGGDNTQKAIDNTSKAIDGMKDEAAKAQTFAGHIDPSKVSEAISDYQALRKGL